MKTPIYNEAGLVGFALANATLGKLVDKGILTPRDELDILITARDSLRGLHSGSTDRAADLLADAATRHPEAK